MHFTNGKLNNSITIFSQNFISGLHILIADTFDSFWVQEQHSAGQFPNILWDPDPITF